MKLSILILTIEKRKLYLKDLLYTLKMQVKTDDVEVLINYNENTSIGRKRNQLLEQAKGEYVCFFDDDDMPSNDYIETLLKAIETNPDCVSLRGIMTTNGSNPEIFEHSIRYKKYKTNEKAKYPEVKYERYPNHISCIKSSIAKQFKFPEINHGEDTDFATQIFKSGLLKKEFYVDSVLYYYKYITNK